MLNFHVGNLAGLIDNVSSFIVGTDPVEIPLDALMPPVHTLSKTSTRVEIFSVHFFAVTPSNLVELCFSELVDVELHLQHCPVDVIRCFEDSVGWDGVNPLACSELSAAPDPSLVP